MGLDLTHDFSYKPKGRQMLNDRKWLLLNRIKKISEEQGDEIQKRRWIS
jgi:hypothetical protein